MSYRKPSEKVSRSPSPTPRPRQPPLALSIRTAASLGQPAPPAMQQSSPQSQRPYPFYPLPIAPERQPRALQLYRTYCLAERAAQSPAVTRYHDGYHLEVPGGQSAQSVTSRGSSKIDRPGSVATSYLDATESVLSFDDAQSPGSVNQGEITTFTGQKVKPKRRSKLSSPAREKAALIRWLKSCWVCRDRRVPCPLEHHDIECLKALDRKNPHSLPRRSHAHRQSRSSNSSSSRPRAVSSPAMTTQLADTLQLDTLIGLGAEILQTQNVPNYSTTLEGFEATTPTVLVRQPTSLIYGGAAGAASLAPAIAFNPDPYSSWSDRGMLPLGVLRNNFFVCQCLTVCNALFPDAEALQNHWPIEHFEFNRINPAHRYICGACNHMNNYPTGPCFNCQVDGQIEMWIYGSFIRNASFRPERPNGRDIRLFGSASSTNWSPYTHFGHIDSQFGSNMDGSMDDGNFDGNLTPGNFDMNSDGGGYGGPSSQGYTYDPFGSQTPNSGSNQFNTHTFHALKSFTVHVILPTTRHAVHRFKTMLILLILLAAITFGYAHDYLIAQARHVLPQAKAQVQANLPTLGLLTVIGSSIVCLSAKHIFHHHRLRRMKHCPLHTLATRSMDLGGRSKHRPPGPEAYLGGGVYSC